MFINLQQFAKYPTIQTNNYINPNYKNEKMKQALFNRFVHVYNKWSFSRRKVFQGNSAERVNCASDTEVLNKIKHIFDYLVENNIDNANIFVNTLEEIYNVYGKEVYLNIEFINSINKLNDKICQKESNLKESTEKRL